MALLVASSAFFLAIHFGISGTRVRDRLVGALGETPYLGLFSLASIAGLTGMILGYARAPYVELWGQLLGLRWPAAVVMLLAFELVFLGLITPGPTTVGADSLLSKGAVGIHRITRHPFLCGVALWGWTHLLVNGDAASAVLFGSLALLATLGPVVLDRRKARLLGERWAPYARETSALPFRAIAEGRQQLALGELGPFRLALGALLFGLTLVMHARIFGGVPIPG